MGRHQVQDMLRTTCPTCTCTAITLACCRPHTSLIQDCQQVGPVQATACSISPCLARSALLHLPRQEQHTAPQQPLATLLSCVITKALVSQVRILQG
jgi:hypothetical protein